MEEASVMKLQVRFGAPSIAMSTRSTPRSSMASPRQPNMASRKPMSLLRLAVDAWPITGA